MPDRNLQCVLYAGLEGTAPDMLLRSMVVVPAPHGRGHGVRVVALEWDGAALSPTRLHMSTTTAAPFFEHKGYVVADRNEAPPLIAATE